MKTVMINKQKVVLMASLEATLASDYSGGLHGLGISEEVLSDLYSKIYNK